MPYFLQQLLNGVHAGALYALLAFGYALVNAVLHRTNLAHGAVFAFAGQIAILAALWAYDVLWVVLPLAVGIGLAAACASGAAASTVLARSVFGPLRESTPNGLVVATLGTALVLGELGRIAADTRDLWLPPMLNMPVVFASVPGFRVTLTVIQLMNCTAALACILLLSLFLSRSRWGRQWRALSDDPLAARLCGVDTERIFESAVLFGGLVAALAGVLAALYYGNISFGTGLIFGLKILFVTAAGSYDSPPRAALGAGLFGIAEALWSGYFPLEWRDAWMFAFLVATLVLTRAGEAESAPRQR